MTTKRTVEVRRACLDAGADDVVLRLPDFALYRVFGIAARHRLLLERLAAGANIVGGFINEILENFVAGQSQEVRARENGS
ncbi:MAG: hypothetical protein E5Y82_31310 [Mesorhizobium sp.]|nr:MAG: hypothetical protein E5Y82_31310 [Mesorhizobium sp.]